MLLRSVSIRVSTRAIPFVFILSTAFVCGQRLMWSRFEAPPGSGENRNGRIALVDRFQIPYAVYTSYDVRAKTYARIVCRYDPDGVLQNSFVVNRWTEFPYVEDDIAIDATGDLHLAYSLGDSVHLRRFTSDGNELSDRTIALPGPGISVKKIAVRNDGAIVLAGTQYESSFQTKAWVGVFSVSGVCLASDTIGWSGTRAQLADLQLDTRGNACLVGAVGWTSQDFLVCMFDMNCCWATYGLTALP